MTATLEVPIAVPQNTIASLTARLAACDEEAFREFHTLYFDRLHQFLLVVSRGQEHEAQEALQETMIRVARHVRRFEEEEIFWCWLKMVARTAARDAGRKRSRYTALLDRFLVSWCAPVIDGRQEEEHLSALLEETLLELDPKDRQLLLGKYLEAQSVNDLSSQTGLTGKAVESRLVRLRRQMRQILLAKLGRS